MIRRLLILICCTSLLFIPQGAKASGNSELRKWQTINGKKYYFDKKGKKLTGWQKIGKNGTGLIKKAYTLV